LCETPSGEVGLEHIPGEYTVSRRCSTRLPDVGFLAVGFQIARDQTQCMV
jgi:hypothetical protein